jgi:4-hydroxy-4-methyl-2-oxoglutarate aldolase
MDLKLGQQLVDRLAAIPYTGAISDILDEMGVRGQTLPAQIQTLVSGHTVAGRAFTVLGEATTSQDPEVIFVPFLRMLGALQPGDVLVVQPNDAVSSHIGELTSETAKYRGARGAVIDGGARDTQYIQNLGFPVFARYRTPRDIVGRWRLVDYNVPIQIGGTTVRPGDFVVGDRDGVLILPVEIAEEVITKAEEVIRTENLVRKAILDGMLPLDAYEKFGRF